MMVAMGDGHQHSQSTSCAFLYGPCWHQTRTRYASFVLYNSQKRFAAEISPSLFCNLTSEQHLDAETSLLMVQRRPAGDLAYCNRTRGRSPKDTRWDFDDDTV